MNPENPELPADETECLNCHGVFFKKRVLRELHPPFKVIDEELGVTFERTRAIDILATDTSVEPRVLYILECKRVDASARRWIFFEHSDIRFRFSRVAGDGEFSQFAKGQSEILVCSEGYEYVRPDEHKPKSQNEPQKRCDQNPVFEAASQLSSAYLGLISRRLWEFKRAGTTAVQERYVPILVTTADLTVVTDDLSRVDLRTGKMANGPICSSVEWLVYKHPFPSSDGLLSEFRMPFGNASEWSLLRKECIFVVRAGSMIEFLRKFRFYLRDCTDPAL